MTAALEGTTAAVDELDGADLAAFAIALAVCCWASIKKCFQCFSVAPICSSRYLTSKSRYSFRCASASSFLWRLSSSTSSFRRCFSSSTSFLRRFRSSSTSSFRFRFSSSSSYRAGVSLLVQGSRPGVAPYLVFALHHRSQCLVGILCCFQLALQFQMISVLLIIVSLCHVNTVLFMVDA